MMMINRKVRRGFARASVSDGSRCTRNPGLISTNLSAFSAELRFPLEAWPVDQQQQPATWP